VGVGTAAGGERGARWPRAGASAGARRGASARYAAASPALAPRDPMCRAPAQAPPPSHLQLETLEALQAAELLRQRARPRQAVAAQQQAPQRAQRADLRRQRGQGVAGEDEHLQRRLAPQRGRKLHQAQPLGADDQLSREPRLRARAAGGGRRWGRACGVRGAARWARGAWRGGSGSGSGGTVAGATQRGRGAARRGIAATGCSSRQGTPGCLALLWRGPRDAGDPAPSVRVAGSRSNSMPECSMV
jgi:hypothetical protein